MKTRGYMMRPEIRTYHDGGHLLLGPIQFNWGRGGGQMPRGLRVHLTWPGKTHSLYLG